MGGPSLNSKGCRDSNKTENRGQPSIPIDEFSYHNKFLSSTGSKERQETERYALCFVLFLSLKGRACSKGLMKVG